MTDFGALLRAPGTVIEAEDDFDAINALFRDKGWSDGLPLVPPTGARVERMLAYCDRPWDEPVGRMAPRYGEATPLRLAANAVMAGCRPEYFPLLVATVEALCDERFNLYGVQATTHPCAPLIIVNGPIAQALGINSGHNAFGPGAQANATLGRALRLALVNIGGAIPGLGDMSTFGGPHKYGYCVAENEEASPWEPLHVERGLPPEASAVTVVGAEAPHNVNDHESHTAEGICTTIAGTLATTGNNDLYYDAEPLIVFGPEHAATAAAQGWSKADVRRYIHRRAQLPLGRFSRENIERRLRVAPLFEGRYAEAGDDAPVPMLRRPEALMIVVIGGAGKHSAVIPTFGATHAVTRALTTRDGQLARSVEDFRRR
jgi:hypothetical protein